jgi:proline racemase
MAQLFARGELALGADFVNESVIGTRFTGRLVEETTVGGVAAVVPEITGRAWITGMGQYLLDASDPFPAGFSLS